MTEQDENIFSPLSFPYQSCMRSLEFLTQVKIMRYIIIKVSDILWQKNLINLASSIFMRQK